MRRRQTKPLLSAVGEVHARTSVPQEDLFERLRHATAQMARPRGAGAATESTKGGGRARAREKNRELWSAEESRVPSGTWTEMDFTLFADTPP